MVRWIGRYFDELNPDLNLEIPQWILDTYADQWNYEGPGFVLVNEYTGELVVLLDQEHTLSKGIKLTYTEKGQNKFGLTESLIISTGLILFKQRIRMMF